MQTPSKVSQQQLTAQSGANVTTLRFTGDVSSASRDAVVGAYEALDKATHKPHPARLHQGRLPQLLRHRPRYPGPHGGRQVRPDRIAICGLSPHFTKVFTMVGIPKYATLYPNEPDALAAL